MTRPNQLGDVSICERFWPRPWSATRPVGEEMVQLLDAHGRTILRLEWPFHSDHDADDAEQATYALSDAIAALPSTVEALDDALAFMRGDIAGKAQREGIIREGEAALGATEAADIISKLVAACEATKLAIENAGNGKYTFGDLYRQIDEAISLVGIGERSGQNKEGE